MCSGQTQCQASTGFGDFCSVSGVSVSLQTSAQWGKCCRGRGWNGTALLSPQRCKWLLVKEDLLLQTKTWHRHHFTALSDFNLMEPFLFKSHHSWLTSGVKILNRNVSVCNHNWILQTSPLHYIDHAMISFSSTLVWEQSLVYHRYELLCREFTGAGAQERNG